MIRFKLEDEKNGNKPYTIEINFVDIDEFYDWSDNNKDFEESLK
jgi:hypothetical protein